MEETYTEDYRRDDANDDAREDYVDFRAMVAEHYDDVSNGSSTDDGIDEEWTDICVSGRGRSGVGGRGRGSAGGRGRGGCGSRGRGGIGSSGRGSARGRGGVSVRDHGGSGRSRGSGSGRGRGRGTGSGMGGSSEKRGSTSNNVGDRYMDDDDDSGDEDDINDSVLLNDILPDSPLPNDQLKLPKVEIGCLKNQTYLCEDGLRQILLENNLDPKVQQKMRIQNSIHFFFL